MDIRSPFLESHTVSESAELLLKYRQSNSVPNYFSPQDFYRLREETRQALLKELYSKDVPLIVTGHQPEFYHWGILSKDIYADKLAKSVHGKAVHIFLDTDVSHIEFLYPEPLQNSETVLQNPIFFENPLVKTSSFVFKNEAQKISKYYLESSEDRNIFQNIIKQLIEQPGKLQPYISVEISEKWLNLILSLLDQGLPIRSVIQEITKQYFSQQGLDIITVNASEILSLGSYRKFISVIQNSVGQYRLRYNSALQNYRNIHKIKNNAQPLPNLPDDQLPFWVLDAGSGCRKKAVVPYEADSCFLPNAITFTMFIRLFFSDYFIHGKGGYRYEKIGDSILSLFFSSSASPYCMVSADVYPKKNINNQAIVEKITTIEKTERTYTHSPEAFLSEAHPLYQKKKQLLELMNQADTNKKQTHAQIKEVNVEIQALLEHIHKEIQDLKTLQPLVKHHLDFLSTRTLPFFFLDNCVSSQKNMGE
jgi:hypothetical protein